jgi:hypothetical protein
VFYTVVAGERLLGFRLGSCLKKNMVELDAFLENPYVSLVPVTLTTADRFAHRRRAPRQGKADPDERHLDRCPRHGSGRRSVVVRRALRSD